MVEKFTELASRHDARFVIMPATHLIRLNSYLQEGERIEITLRSWGVTHIEGSNVNVRGRRQGRQYGHAWLIITNVRLIIVSKGLLSFEVRTFQFSQISSIEVQEGVIDDILIISGLGLREIWVFRRKIRDLVKAVSVVIQTRLPSSNAADSSQKPEDALSVLKMRLAKGEISEAEFENLRRLL